MSDIHRTRSSASAQKSKPRTSVNPGDVKLITGKGSPGRGGCAGEAYWHIHVGDKRVGYVFINVIDDPVLDRHASIQIHLNQTARGKHIGRVAYQLACDLSDHKAVIAHMRKSNAASRRAAEAAGFTVVEDHRLTQLAMIWKRGNTL